MIIMPEITLPFQLSITILFRDSGVPTAPVPNLFAWHHTVEGRGSRYLHNDGTYNYTASHNRRP